MHLFQLLGVRNLTLRETELSGAGYVKGATGAVIQSDKAR